MSEKRKDYITWDEYFMGVAVLSSKRSKDPSTQVGACVASNDNKVVTMGYNGMPVGLSDDEMPWGRVGKDELDNKYLYVCHAEFNAILNSYAPVKGCKIYVTLFPCNECAKAIIQSGIKEVVYLNERIPEDLSTKASKRLLMMSGIIFRKYEGRKLDILVKEYEKVD
ncbi:deoxycytidylate deaminase [Firmicutes bacterium CAG:449]|nr:deoxycytidylate deaminase [Firmicutes bacterium CAG:449]